MDARVLPGTKLPFVKAFGGYEFVHGAWRAVPEGFEEAAQVHPLLEVREEEVALMGTPLPITEPVSAGPEEVTTDEDAGPTLQRGSGRRQRSSDG